MKVLVLGATGMLGSALFRFFSGAVGFDCYGTARDSRSKIFFPVDLHDNLLFGCDVDNFENLVTLFSKVKPDVVVNAIGLVKQLSSVTDPLHALPINSLLPHRLARLCMVANCRLVHISTDCVFSGARGMYVESDLPDAVDLYGMSKYIGEVDYDNAITLRTSIIGHELDGARSLINWFLGQNDVVNGYKKAVFSGLPTVEIARIIRDFVIPHPELTGLYHVSAQPINKFDLLSLVAKVYNKEILIQPDESFCIDRSLDSTRFRTATGYEPPSWSELVVKMRQFG